MCFAVNALSFLAVLAALLAMRTDELVQVERGARMSVMAGVREGLAWVRATPSARVVLTVVAISSVFGFNFHVLVPLLAADTLDVGPRGPRAPLRRLRCAARSSERSRPPSRASAANDDVPRRRCRLQHHTSRARPRHRARGCAPAPRRARDLLHALSHDRESLVQLAAPDHLRGRVVSIYLLAFAGLAPAGGLIAGALTELGGTGLAFSLAGVVGLACTAWAKSCRPSPELGPDRPRCRCRGEARPGRPRRSSRAPPRPARGRRRRRSAGRPTGIRRAERSRPSPTSGGPVRRRAPDRRDPDRGPEGHRRRPARPRASRQSAFGRRDRPTVTASPSRR